MVAHTMLQVRMQQLGAQDVRLGALRRTRLPGDLCLRATHAGHGNSAEDQRNDAQSLSFDAQQSQGSSYTPANRLQQNVAGNYCMRFYQGPAGLRQVAAATAVAATLVSISGDAIASPMAASLTPLSGEVELHEQHQSAGLFGGVMALPQAPALLASVGSAVASAEDAVRDMASGAADKLEHLVPPAVSRALQPAAQGAANVWNGYEDLLDRYPLPIKMLTGAVGTFLGDLLAQYSSFWLERRKGRRQLAKRQAAAAAAVVRSAQQRSARRARRAGIQSVAAGDPSQVVSVQTSASVTLDSFDQDEAAAAEGLRTNLKADIAAATRTAAPEGSGGKVAAAIASAVEPRFQYNWVRAARYILFYTVVSTPVDVTFYDWLDQVVLPDQPGSLQAAVGKMLADELVSTPLLTASLFATMRYWEGRGDQAIPFIKKNLWPTLVANYKVWPLAQVVNFLLIPASQRILYIEFVSVFWIAFLSYVVNAKDSEPEELTEEQQRQQAVAAVEAASAATAARLAQAQKQNSPKGSDMASFTLSAAVAGASAVATATSAVMASFDMEMLETVSGAEVAGASVLAFAAMADAAKRYKQLRDDDDLDTGHDMPAEHRGEDDCDDDGDSDGSHDAEDIRHHHFLGIGAATSVDQNGSLRNGNGIAVHNDGGQEAPLQQQQQQQQQEDAATAERDRNVVSSGMR